MKKSNISVNVIRRMPRYLRKLEELEAEGLERISSARLGEEMGLTPSQIRQDFSCFGEFGQQGYGYNVRLLREEIANILGMNRSYSVILVGVGNLGHALAENFGFSEHGFRLEAAFDIKPELVGTTVGGVPIHSGLDMPAYVDSHEVDIAVLAVPRDIASELANGIAEHGVRAIWNFTNVELKMEDPTVLVEDIHFADSLLALSYYLTESLGECKA